MSGSVVTPSRPLRAAPSVTVRLPSALKRGWSPETLAKVPTYEEVQESLTRIPVYCLGSPNRSHCSAEISSDATARAKVIVEQQLGNLRLDDVKVLILSLVCPTCQQRSSDNVHLWKVAKRWEAGIRHDIARIKWSQPVGMLSTYNTALRRHSESTIYTPPSSVSSSEQAVTPPSSPSLHIRAARRRVDSVMSPDQSTAPSTPSEAAPRIVHITTDEDEPMYDADDAVTRTVDTPMPDLVQHNHPRAAPFVTPDNEPFRPGKASAWSPKMIVEEVKDLLREEIPLRNFGTLYAFRDVQRRYVKIGISQQRMQDRRRQIQDKSGIRLDENDYFWKSDIPLRLLHRLEKIIHADLAYAQRKLLDKSKMHTQHEWFEIGWEEAQACMDFWYNVVTRSPRWPVELNDDVDASFLVAHDEQSRQRINSDHTRRLEYWREHIIIPEKHTWRSFLRWLMGCCIIGLVPLALNVPDKYTWPLVVLAIASWTRNSAGFR